MRSRDQILKQIHDKVHHPATARELMQVLRVPRTERQSFRRLLKGLVDDGELLQIRGNRFGLADRMDVVVGRLQMHAAGYGFVVADTPREGGDLYVAPTNVKDALHGDRVVARIEHQRGDRTEGRIIRILDRANATLVGRYDVDETSMGFVVPFDRRVLADVQVPAGEALDAAAGDMVLVELTRWPTATRPPAGRVLEVLGPIDEAGVDTRIIIRKHGLPDEHGADAVAEAARLGDQVDEADLAGRTDFRGLPTVTIDGEHARDFDDAITLETLRNGHYWLGVHIADVSHYVEEGSPLDVEAYDRGTSVYFPERALHMFPPQLATGLCSLRPHVDRLVQSCLMEVTRSGDVVRAEFHDGVIVSDERMTYTDVNAILDGDSAVRKRYAPLVPLFELMRDLFAVLNGRRRRRGSVDFDLPQAEVLMDEAGRIENIVAAERNVAHRLIEEFMLAANEVVAEHLQLGGQPALFRVHMPPDVQKIEDLKKMLEEFGHKLRADPEQLRPGELQRVLKQVEGTPEERFLTELVLRSMKRALYSEENLGHFALALQFYCHFTSPIRRYPDLVVHRMLGAMLESGPLIGETLDRAVAKLPLQAGQSSEREKRAEDAEREVIEWKKVIFMRDKVGEQFAGRITGVLPFGLFVELDEIFVQGLVPVSTIGGDFWAFFEREHRLRGESSGREFRLGEAVLIEVYDVDEDRRQIGFRLIEAAGEPVSERGAPPPRGRPR